MQKEDWSRNNNMSNFNNIDGTSEVGCLTPFVQILGFAVIVVVTTMAWNLGFGPLTHIWFTFPQVTSLFFCIYCVFRVAATAVVHSLPEVFLIRQMRSMESLLSAYKATVTSAATTTTKEEGKSTNIDTP